MCFAFDDKETTVVENRHPLRRTENKRARDGYDPIPAPNPVAGAFGDRERDTPTDRDTALETSRTLCLLCLLCVNNRGHRIHLVQKKFLLT